MNILDQRIAEEIMGERWIDLPFDTVRAWRIFPDEGGWEPLPFSTDWNCCMKAVKALGADGQIHFDPSIDGVNKFVPYMVEIGIGERAPSSSKVEMDCHSMDDLPRVICESLLEYKVETSKQGIFPPWNQTDHREYDPAEEI